MRVCDCACVRARACVRANVCVHVRVHAWSRQGRGEQPMVSGYGRIGYAPRGAARPLASTRLTILGARPCTCMHACAIDLRRQLRPAREGRERTKANECAEHSCVSCGTQRYVRGKASAAVNRCGCARGAHCSSRPSGRSIASVHSGSMKTAAIGANEPKRTEQVHARKVRLSATDWLGPPQARA